jgi:hypothetical protein
MKDKEEFVHYSDVFGPLIMEATTWAEVVSELYNSGVINSGKIKVVKRTYKWVSDEPQIINTDYFITLENEHD